MTEDVRELETPSGRGKMGNERVLYDLTGELRNNDISGIRQDPRLDSGFNWRFVISKGREE